MATISTDNNVSRTDISEMTDEQVALIMQHLAVGSWDTEREQVHGEIAPCTDRAFVARLAELTDVVVG